MKKVLVTGCAGFIGRHLCERLVRDGQTVVGVDNFATSERSSVPQGIEFIEGDLSDYGFAFPDGTFSHVFHLAAIPRIPISFEQPVRFLRNNVNSTISVLEFCRERQAKMIFSSSSSVYGDQDRYPVTEDMTPHPGSPYAVSKLIGEELCANYRAAFAVPSVVLRYFNVIGTGMTTKNGYATVLPIWLEQRDRGEPLTITGDGSQERDFTAVDDVVEANVLAMDRGEGIFNIGSCRPRKVIDVARMISGNIVHIESRKEAKVTHADNTKAKTVLNWEPKRTLEDVMKEIV